MSQEDKLLLSVLRGTQDANIPFLGMQKLLSRLGFSLRVRGDHCIYTKDGVEEILNLQPRGNKAKVYQVKQVRDLILKYQLGGSDDA